MNLKSLYINIDQGFHREGAIQVDDYCVILTSLRKKLVVFIAQKSKRRIMSLFLIFLLHSDPFGPAQIAWL